MTLSKRNIFILLIIALISILIIFTAVLPFFLENGTDTEITNLFFQSPHYITPVLLLIFSAGTLLIVRYYFFKTNSPEIFFFIAFLFTIILDLARAYIHISILLNMSLVYAVFLSRVAYYGKIAGTAALFVSALYTSDFQIRRHGTPAAIIAVMSFIVSSSMPLSFDFLPNLVLKPGGFTYFIFTMIFIEVLAVMIFLLNYLQEKSRDYLLLAVSLVLIFSGRELTFYYYSYPFFLSGLLLLCAGSYLFLNIMHRIYSWY